MVSSTASSGYATYLKAKSVRLIAVLGEERIPEYPDVPTLMEDGYPWHFRAGM